MAGSGGMREDEAVSWIEQTKNEENEPQCSSWLVLVTHIMVLPFPASPLVNLPPPFPHRASLSRPHPSGKGRGGCNEVRGSGCAEALVCEPTSLKGGEGLIAGLSRLVGGRSRSLRLERSCSRLELSEGVDEVPVSASVKETGAIPDGYTVG